MYLFSKRDETVLSNVLLPVLELPVRPVRDDLVVRVVPDAPVTGRAFDNLINMAHQMSKTRSIFF